MSASAAPVPFRPRDLLEQVVLHGLCGAPDRAEVAYARRTIEDGAYRSRLWRVSLDGGAPEQLTDGPFVDRLPCFSPDGGRLLFVSDRGGAAAPWILTLADGSLRELGSFPGEASAAAWSPDGAQVAVIAASGEHRYAVGDPADPIAYRVRDLVWHSPVTGLVDELNAVWTAPADGGAPPRRLTPPDVDAIDVLWLPGGEALAVICDAAPERFERWRPQLWRLGLAGGELTPLTALRGIVLAAACSPAGGLAVLGTDRPEGAVEWAQPELLALADGGTTALSRALDRPARNVASSDLLESDGDGVQLAWDGEERIVALVGEGGASAPWAFALDGSAPAPLGPRGRYACTSLARAGGRLAVLAGDGGRPGEVYEVRDGALHALTGHGSAWLGARRRDPDELRAVAADGTALQGWLVRPAHDGPAPLVVQMHGGPNSAYGVTPWLEALALASAGVGVLYVNPRGSAGYGVAFAREERPWGAHAPDDVLALIDAAVAAGGADPARVGLMGISYAGYLTLELLGREPDRFRAAVAENPVADFVSLHGSWVDDPDTFPNLVGIGRMPEALEDYVRLSPWTRILRSHVPLLLLQGERDNACPPHQTALIYVLMRIAQREVELVRYPDEGHVFCVRGRPDRRVDRLERIVDWFTRHLLDGAPVAGP